LPRRENVGFHETRADAERAGFRACRRCLPDGPDLAARHASAISSACRALDAADETPDLDTLAASAGMSRFHFQRVFKKIVGLTPKAYAVARRAERVRKELPKRATVTEAIYGAGFNSSGRFYEEATRMLGMAPKHFRAGGDGEIIRFAIGECSLGSILVAASEKGVCSVMLGDDPGGLAKNLQDRFSRARLVGGDRAFERLVARVIGCVENPGSRCGLPLDVRGTVFQRKVWDALLKIPSGSTASYAEIARRIGEPMAVRAVAGACAANAIAIAIPCHRVVRSDGSLSGYRWGVERKRALLLREARK